MLSSFSSEIAWVKVMTSYTGKHNLLLTVSKRLKFSYLHLLRLFLFESFLFLYMLNFISNYSSIN